ncbi:hypothetical protein RBA41_19880 [Massilia sp. CCM 9210]|nr:hypothetical protein [Massilia sp. CCM 9210]MDQ1815563.1 hypothetical protein [Massilia sp. CCM 9210]
MKLGFKTWATALRAFVPGVIVERARAVEIVFHKMTIDELALDELAACKAGAAKCAVREFYVDEQRAIKQAPIPRAALNGAADKSGIHIPALGIDPDKFAILINMIIPPGRFSQGCFESFAFK